YLLPPLASLSSAPSLHDALPIYRPVDGRRPTLRATVRRSALRSSALRPVRSIRPCPVLLQPPSLQHGLWRWLRISRILRRIGARSGERTSEIQSLTQLFCRLLLV